MYGEIKIFKAPLDSVVFGVLAALFAIKLSIHVSAAACCWQ